MSWSVAPAPLGSGQGQPRPQLDRGAGRTVLIVVLSVLGLVGAVAVTWFAIASAELDGGTVALALAAVPVPFLVAAYLWLDRYEPEPVRFVAAALLWGAVISTTFAGLVQLVLGSTVDPPRWSMLTVVAPVTEEFAKGLLCVLVLLRRRKVAGVLDGIIYAGLVGVGFAFTENVLYISGAYAGSLIPEFSGPAAATGVFAIRGLVSPFAHPLFTMAIGIGMAVAIRTSRRWLRWLAPLSGYALAVGLHGTWNGSTLLLGGFGFPLVYLGVMVPLFGVAIFVATRALNREADVVRTALREAASRGWLHPSEVHWLVKYGDRAAARRFAGKVAGKDAVKALHAYQLSATEMALMHDRVLRGRAPTDGVQRVLAHLYRMRSWRPFLVLPPESSIPTGRPVSRRGADHSSPGPVGGPRSPGRTGGYSAAPDPAETTVRLD